MEQLSTGQGCLMRERRLASPVGERDAGMPRGSTCRAVHSGHRGEGGSTTSSSSPAASRTSPTTAVPTNGMPALTYTAARSQLAGRGHERRHDQRVGGHHPLDATASVSGSSASVPIDTFLPALSSRSCGTATTINAPRRAIATYCFPAPCPPNVPRPWLLVQGEVRERPCSRDAGSRPCGDGSLRAVHGLWLLGRLLGGCRHRVWCRWRAGASSRCSPTRAALARSRRGCAGTGDPEGG